VRILPTAQRVGIDSTAVVRVHVDDIKALHGYSVQVSYDPKIVRLVKVRQLNFFGDKMTFFARQIDSTAGSVTADEAILGAYGEGGSGDMVELSFTGLRSAVAPLAFVKADFRDTVNSTIVVSSYGSTILVGTASTVEEANGSRDVISISANYPNPFNSSTAICYFLPKSGRTTFRIYNMLGKEVFSRENDREQEGEHSLVWEGKDRYGRILSSGAYMLVIQMGGFTACRKLLYLK
jgi:hypothetical protein